LDTAGAAGGSSALAMLASGVFGGLTGGLAQNLGHRDCTRHTCAVEMRAFLAAERIKGCHQRVCKFGMFEIDSGIDHRGRNATISPLNLRRILVRRLALMSIMNFRMIRFRLSGKARELRFDAKPIIWREPPLQGVATARLTIFSFCSLLKRPATSSLLIARLPNCSLNMPPFAPSMIEA
jgi:hypothetical protein